MAIIVNGEKCQFCGKCVLVCPCDVMRLDVDAEKAVAKYEADCKHCSLCLKYCSFSAIELTL